MEEILQEYENREFMIFNVSELDQINFTQVHETSAETVRKSVDGSKTFVTILPGPPCTVLILHYWVRISPFFSR